MRDAVHIVALFLLFALLATRFPSEIANLDCKDKAQSTFASFVDLSAADYAACIEATRPSWQVRSAAGGRPSVGRLDVDIPLLEESLPPPQYDALSGLSSPASLPPPDIDAYSFLPQTLGRDEPAFSARVLRSDTDHPPEAGMEAKAVPFSRADMLSTENSRTLKEIMQ